ncbi:pentatricopeptide repeat-containing protein At5g66520-like [Aristolochia californica]|uniref:pentatricopeptide repeat-containing protein At5g66520-like n=1 Tax=Aristolochia californica TaxID=171875 RepID=UPI0035E2978D
MVKAMHTKILRSCRICFIPKFSPSLLLAWYPVSSNSIRKSTLSHPITLLVQRAQEHFLHPKVIHSHSITTGLIKDTFAASRIIEFCFKSKPVDAQYARQIFNSIDQPDVYTWNMMIIGLAECESPQSGIDHFYQMLLRKVVPTDYTFALVVKASIICKNDHGLGLKVHGQMLKHGVEELLIIKNSLIKMYCNMGCLEEAQLLFEKSLCLDLISWNSMISVYGKHGNVQSARGLFDKMPERSLVSWSAMIDGYVRSGDYSEALQLFNGMQGSGVRPDVVTLVSVLKACANLGALDQGRQVHLYIKQSKMLKDVNVILGTALVDMYAKCGCINEALEVFQGFQERDIILWNSMISGLALNGHGEEAVKHFWRMRELGMIPNGSTFVSVLSACSHAGLVHEGQEIFYSMKKDYGIDPQLEHYGCLSDLLGRAGLVEEALEILSNMPMEPKASNWGALLAACKSHNNTEVGERVGKHLIELEPREGKRYILFFNLYAGDERWNDALEMRKMMEEKGIKKENGCSFIQ